MLSVLREGVWGVPVVLAHVTFHLLTTFSGGMADTVPADGTVCMERGAGPAVPVGCEARVTMNSILF